MFQVSVIADRHDGSMAAFLEAERRVGLRIKVKLDARLFTHVDPANTVRTIENDSHVTARVSWNF